MNRPKYWQALEELEQTPEAIQQASKEFPTDIPLEDSLEQSDSSMDMQANRRDFLKALGFGVTAATLSACVEAPVRKAIPYVNKPDDVIPGVANWYASTTPEGTPVLVKTRVGRPIKLEGNPDSSLTGGGLSAIGQATVLELYDVDRIQGPMKGTNLSDWTTVDQEIVSALNSIKANGGKVRILSHTISQPATQELIDQFLADFEDAKHVTYDPISSSAIASAHEADYGIRNIPSYHFDKAKVIVSFSCDFLGTWLSPVSHAYQYAKHRDPDGEMSRHLQFESLLSLTGSNADLRFPIKPSQEGLALLNLYNKIARKIGRPTLPSIPQFNVAMNGLDVAAQDLLNAQGESLVVCGTNDVATQQLVNAINDLLGNYGNTIDLSNPLFARKGNDEELEVLVGEIERGEVDALLIYGANPVYDTPAGEVLVGAMSNIELTVSFAGKVDETSDLCKYTCPSHHYLESWSDAQQTVSHVSIVQPMINPIFDTRQPQDCLLKWSGSNVKFVDYLKQYWENYYYPLRQDEGMSFREFWVETLRKGVLELDISEEVEAYANETDLVEVSEALLNQLKRVDDGMELVVYPKVSMADGKYANNPWLQELPDPITRITWDNYLTVAISDAEENNLKLGDVVRLTVRDKSLNVPVVPQPGQAKGTLGIALGYGREKGGKVIDEAGGVNVYPMLEMRDGTITYTQVSGVSMEKSSQTYKLARTQTFNTLYDPAKGELGLIPDDGDYDRSEYILKETSLAYYKGEGENPYTKAQDKYQEKKKHLVSLWDSYFEDPESKRIIHWAMAIDLNKCTGCGACVVSCQAENNVPVVGKDEVYKRREMHWLRIDRYYSGNPDSPDVAFQPMLCQHCDNAPCETVCPVLATIHSNEGLNQMTYNRCVGTRYCANNCPYKVRRFNWFSYPYNKRFKTVNPAQNDYGRLVLNPDVTVRWRGVMEKCSFCVQRLQEAKLKAKVNAQSTFAKPQDGEVQTACQQSCPTGAIVFGDRNDPNSEVYKAMTHERSYLALEEVKTLPSVNYKLIVRNRTEEETMYKEEELQQIRSYGNETEETTA